MPCRRTPPTCWSPTSRCPWLTGLELAQRVHDAQLPTRVVILTTFARAGYLRRALDAGVRGYLLKDAPSDQLAAALRQVHAGGRAIDPQLALAAWGDDDPLTERERQVLRLAGEGVKGAEIAERLQLVAGHGAQLPVGGDRQARCGQPHRGLPGGAGQRLALTGTRPAATVAGHGAGGPVTG